MSVLYDGHGLPVNGDKWPGAPGMQLERVTCRRKWWFWGPWIVRARYRYVGA